MATSTRMCFWILIMLLFNPSLLQAQTMTVQSMVVFGDSLSDIGNTSHLLKSLRQEESAGYLVAPLRLFVINKMEEFADAYHVPQTILNGGIEIVSHFFNTELGPFLASIVSVIRRVPVIPAAPYWQARFSNGRVWNEYLAPMLGIDREDNQFYTNQAFGGSFAVTYDYQLTTWNLIRHPINTLKSLIAGKLIPPSLGLTIQAYLMTNNNKVNESTAFFIFTGGNDYLNVLSFEDNYNPSIMSRYIDNVLNAVEGSVNKLVRAGAKHMVIAGLPNIGLMPRFVNTTDSNVLADAVKQHNERLQIRMKTWQDNFPDVRFVYFDGQNFLQKMIENSAQYGFHVLKEPCTDVKIPSLNVLLNNPFSNNYVLQYAQLLQYRDPAFQPGETNYNVCNTPESYLFWDEVHPTTKAHRYLAIEICERMKEQGYQTNCVY